MPHNNLVRFWYIPLALAWLLFIVSFFLPVTSLGVGEGSWQGWEAFRVALVDGPFSVTSALTNLVVLGTPLIFWVKAPAFVRVLQALAVFAMVLNLWWLNMFSDLQVGYYVWWASFAMITAALCLRYPLEIWRVKPKAEGVAQLGQ